MALKIFYAGGKPQEAADKIIKAHKTEATTLAEFGKFVRTVDKLAKKNNINIADSELDNICKVALRKGNTPQQVIEELLAKRK